jgi:DNA polymerase-3 subunit delta
LVHLSRNRFGVKLEPDAADLLLDLVGPDVGMLASELEKVAVYVGTKPSISAVDVDHMVGAGRVEDVWRLLDSATTGDAPGALEKLDKLIAAGDHPLKLLGGLASSLRKLHHAGELRKARWSLADACAEAGIRTYPSVVAATQKQHAHLGPERVSKLPAMLVQADLDLKSSSAVEPRVVLERLLVQLASPRRD